MYTQNSNSSVEIWTISFSWQQTLLTMVELMVYAIQMMDFICWLLVQMIGCDSGTAPLEKTH